MTKIANYAADTHHIRHGVKAIPLGRHSAGSQKSPFPRQKFRIILKDKLSAAILSNSPRKLLPTRRMEILKNNFIVQFSIILAQFCSL